jgi:putative phosphoesterase
MNTSRSHLPIPRSMKIGVIADTHIPDLRRSLPARVMEIFSSVEIVLHAGDITALDVLQQLQESVSLTFAVYGENDSLEVRTYLQESQVLEFGGLRVGLIHGNRDARRGFSDRVARLLHRNPYQSDYIEFILSRFNNVDAIVFGHTHIPYAKVHEGVFLFNPGSINPSNNNEPSVGLLEITSRGIRGRVLPI